MEIKENESSLGLMEYLKDPYLGLALGAKISPVCGYPSVRRKMWIQLVNLGLVYVSEWHLLEFSWYVETRMSNLESS
jgi:hypothetical protein